MHFQITTVNDILENQQKVICLYMTANEQTRNCLLCSPGFKSADECWITLKPAILELITSCYGAYPKDN